MCLWLAVCRKPQSQGLFYQLQEHIKKPTRVTPTTSSLIDVIFTYPVVYLLLLNYSDYGTKII